MALCAVYSISPSTINAGRYGGQYSVSVTSQNNCTTYTVSESLSWVSYTKSGLTVTINISSNTGVARSGDVLIGGQTLTIYQACGNYPGNAGTISGSTSVCKGQNGVGYSVPAISGATGYVWSLPSGASIASGSNTNSITVNFSSGAVSGTVSVYGTNSCSSGLASNLSVTVNSLPTPSASSNSPVCYGYTINLSSSGGSTYQWSGPNGFSSSSQNPSIGGATASNAGTYYVTVTNSNGCSAQTSTSISVHSQFTSSMSGGTSPICYGTSPGTFTAYGSGGTGSFTFLWYLNGGSTGVTSQTYNPGSLYSSSTIYCAVTNGSCGTVNTNTTSISVYGNLTPGSVGSAQTICYNTAPSGFTQLTSPTGGNLSYTFQWQSSLDNSNWTNISGATSSTYNSGALTTGTYFRRQVTSGSCNPVYSSSFYVIVLPDLTPGSVGSAQTICYNTSPAGFTQISAPSGGTSSFSYQWQSSPDNSNWSNISGATSQTYNSGALTTGTYFRRQVTSGSCTPVYSSSFYVIVLPDLTPGSVGSAQTICYNTSPAGFTQLSAPTGGTSSFSYQWQSSPDNSNWTNISGATSSTYNSGALTTGTYFRRQVTSGSCNPVYSSSFYINVLPNLTPGSVGSAQTICYNTSPAGFTQLSAPTGGTSSFSYQWQCSPDNSNWSNISGATSSTYNSGNLTISTYFRRLVTSGSCGTVGSSSFLVTLKPLASITLQPRDTTIFSNGSATFTLVATGENRSYQWQSSFIGSGSWVDIQGATSDSKIITNDLIFEPKSYRCVVNSTCNSVISNDAKIIVSTNYLSGGEIPDLDNRPLLTDKKVGSTAISPLVNAMGAATLNIPIFTSPGTNGMAPSISLFYTSQSGNGILGYGWHIGGLSSITRTGKSMYYDNEVTSISFTAADRFVLNGERLMLSEGTYGANNSVYFTESSPFSKITAYGSTGNGPTYFLEETKSGLTNEYGNSIDSRQFAGNEGTTAFSWLLNKVYDVNGNYIKYNYSYLNGEYWLRSIVYTGNTAQSLTPYDSLLFNYSIRTTDEVKTRVGSAYIPRTKILQNIIVYCEGVQVHKYEFNYTNGFYSQLVEIKEYGKAQTDTYNPIAIKWGSNGTFMEQYESQITMYDEIQGVETGDYNGDGADEVAIWGNNSTDAGLSLYKLNSYGSFDRVFNRTFPLDYFSPYYKKLPFNSVSDMNGDGIEDLIFSSSDSLLVYMGSTSSQSLFTTKTGRSSVGTEYLPGDFNGDGIGELLTSIYIISFASNQQWSVSLPTGSQRLLVDYDGDGKTDLLTLTYSGYILTKFTYNKSTNQYSVSNSSTFSSTLLNYTNREKIFQGDFNGDFQTDFIAKDEYGWHILDYNGTQYSTNTEYVFSILSSFDPSVPANGHALFVRDINNDGKSDLIQLTNHRTGGNIDGINLVYHLSTGFDFKVENYQRLGSTSLVNPNDYTFGNFYGDGQLDCLYSLFNMFKLKNNDRINLVESVLNGLNLRTNFNYKYIVAPSTQVTRPTLDTLVYVPYRNFVVSSIESLASDNRTRSVEYSFANPILHLSRKGFLGFVNQTTSDNVIGITATTRMDANEKYAYSFPLEEVVKDGEDNILSEKYFTNNTKAYSSGSYFGYISKVISQDILHGVSDTTFYYYDSYGNDTLTIIKQNGELTTTIRNQYIQKNTWCPARVSETSQTKTSGSQPSYQTSSIFRYDNLGRHSSTSVFANLQDSLHVDVTYDNYGNISSKNTKLANGSRRSESYAYDSKQRFTTTLTRGTLSFSYQYDAPTGNITKETAPNSLETNYTFDGFGRQTKKSVSVNQFISTSYSWNIDTPTGAIYYIQQNDTNSISKVWYNNLGQDIKTQTTGFSDPINKKRIYSKRGLLVQESKPYFDTPDPTWNTFSYDSINRIVSSVTNGSTMNYTYGNNDITSSLQVSAGNRLSTVSYNGLGQVSFTTRNNKSLSFEYDNNGKLINANPPASGSTVSYDSRSMLTQESDPDRGNSDYEYNSLGELIGFKTANGDKDSIIYDHIGRDSIRVRDNGQTRYYYYTAGNGKGKVSEISSPEGYKKYSYDIYGNVTRECDSISATEYFPYSYEYNQYGKLSKMTYPGGFAVKYEYNGNGYLQYIRKVDDNSILWQSFSANEYGNITQYKLSGGSITVDKSYDNNGYLTQIKTYTGATTKQWLRYSFDATTGDLSMRKDSLRNITENFGYDLFDQLKWSKVSGQDSLKMDYDDIGNITSKSDVGDYYYNATRIHAVDSISGGQYPGRQNIEYNFFNKPVYIADAEDSLNYIYNVLDNRIKATLYGTGGLVRTTWYAGLYEKTLENSITNHYYYINGPEGSIALAIQTGGGTPVIYYLCKDHLGSITGVMESDGDLVEEYNYDAWGKRRNPTNWSYTNVPAATYTHHGFTGHEHLDMFNLINMNGRVYDSEIARFVSPDPIIQDPYNIMSYNRYSYCLNNPLKYTDPSGYSYQRFWEIFLEEQKGNGQGTQIFNNYPSLWSAYMNAMFQEPSIKFSDFAAKYTENLNQLDEGTRTMVLTFERSNGPNTTRFLGEYNYAIIGYLPIWGAPLFARYPGDVSIKPSTSTFNITIENGISYFRNALEYSGTPYKFGGSSKDGIDCSGVVNCATRNINNRWTTSSGAPPGEWNRIFVNTSSYNNFKSVVIRGDLFLWSNQHTAFYNGGNSLFHAHGDEGTPTGITYDLQTYWIKTFGYPIVYRQIRFR